MAKRRRPETEAIHGAGDRKPGPLTVPIYASSTFVLRDAAEGARFTAATAPERYYTRWGNPTTRDLEDVVARLEGGARAWAAASGMGAIAPALLAALGGGDHAVAGRSLYSATTELFARVLPDLGIETTFVDPSRPHAWAEAVREGTKLVYVETPANPTMLLTDLEEAAKAARSVGALAYADNTFATPVNQRPLVHGFDVVLHSATKYLGGHGDVSAGLAVTATASLFKRLWYAYKLFGPTLGPFEAFLVRRGVKTLPLRIRQHNANAQALAEFLEDRREVTRVHYPGLPSFPQHALARKQMDGFGGMLSFDLKGGYEAGVRFVEAVKVAALAVSLGGVETLVEHPASMTHGPLTPRERKRAGIGEGLVRVSVGLENVEDLKEDFEGALRRAARA
jgi:methionine-gamma-lyase